MKKNIVNKKVLVIVLAVCFFACKKKDTPPPTVVTTPPLNGSMTAKLNGTNWVSIKNSGVLKIDKTNDISALVLNGETSSDIFALGIDFPTASTTLTVGDHDQNGAKDDVVFTYATKTAGGGTLSQHFVDTGNMNITSVDNVNKKVSGTFDFILYKGGSTAATDSIKITSGVFTDISYSIQN